MPQPSSPIPHSVRLEMNTANGTPANNQAAALLQQIALLQNPYAALLGGAGLLGTPPQQQQAFQGQGQGQPFPASNAGLSSLASLLGAQAPQSPAGGMQQLFADAMRLSAPVGDCLDDDERLIAALHESEQKGTTYRRALDGLHGVNGHAANMWKDYYLDHTPRINEQVARRRKPLVAKKPPLGQFASPSESPSHSEDIPSKRGGSVANKAQDTSSRHASSSTLYEPSTPISNRAQPSKGSMRNPRRSPTPPTTIMPSSRGRGYAFTQEEQEYLIKYAAYRSRESPNITKTDICAEIAEKLPHHSATSWSSHWGYNRDSFDPRIEALTKSRVVRPKAEPAEPSILDEEGDEDEDEDGDDSENDNDSIEEESDYAAPASPPTPHRNPRRGGIGRSITNDDLRAMADYVESVGAEFEQLKTRERWEPFHAQYSYRSWPAWQEVWRKYEKDIRAIIAKRRKNKQPQTPSVQPQRAVPSWAKEKSVSTPQKRSRSVLEEEEGSPSAKRTREEDEEVPQHPPGLPSLEAEQSVAGAS